MIGARDALFGILYFDPRRRVEVDELRRIAEVAGAPHAALYHDGSLGIGVQSRGEGSASVSRDSTSLAALTGEIENRGELVADLRRRGVDVGDGTGADIVRALCGSGGAAAAAESMRGLFNAAVWRRERRELILLADRSAGVKTLYYHRGRDFLAFGSTLKAVAAHPSVPRTLDAVALEDQLVLRHPISPRTLLEGVSILEAGALLEVAGGLATIRRYGRGRAWIDTGTALADLERRYLEALERAVARSAPAEPAVMLSGGVDSAVLVALLRRQGHSRIRTFSVHVGDAERSDRAASRAVAELFQTQHRSLDDLDASCLDALPEMLWWQESPALDFHPTYWLGRQMREECDTVLAGYGNDIVWGIVQPRRITGAVVRRLFPPLNELHYLVVRRRMARRDLRRLMPGSAASDLGLLHRLSPYRGFTGDGAADFIAMDQALFGSQVISREVGKILVDAHGLEARLPYADSGVAAVAAAVPPAARLFVHADGQTELKTFFKHAIERQALLPPAMIHRPKRWLFSPTAEWLRGDLGATVEALLLGRRCSDRGLFDRRRVGTLLDQHRCGRADHAYALMSLAAVEIWLRLFVDPPALAGPQFTLADAASSGSLT